MVVEAVSPVPMFAAIMSYGTSTSCQHRQDFVELAEGIVFAACTSGFQMENRPDRALFQRKANPGPLSIVSIGLGSISSSSRTGKHFMTFIRASSGTKFYLAYSSK